MLALSRDYYDTPGGHVRIFKLVLRRDIEAMGSNI